jgi:hypothetical protein
MVIFVVSARPTFGNAGRVALELDCKAVDPGIEGGEREFAFYMELTETDAKAAATLDSRIKAVVVAEASELGVNAVVADVVRL